MPRRQDFAGVASCETVEQPGYRFLQHKHTDWWFGTVFFPYIGNTPNWLIFFREGETTNQYIESIHENLVFATVFRERQHEAKDSYRLMGERAELLLSGQIREAGLHGVIRCLWNVNHCKSISQWIMDWWPSQWPWLWWKNFKKKLSTKPWSRSHWRTPPSPPHKAQHRSPPARWMGGATFMAGHSKGIQRGYQGENNLGPKPLFTFFTRVAWIRSWQNYFEFIGRIACTLLPWQQHQPQILPLTFSHSSPLHTGNPSP